ncbi:MAG: amidohydrolase family protein [Chloroflexi bacterium]|nr:amidohydrolase family protein [Chloroflexota bacterium]
MIAINAGTLIDGTGAAHSGMVVLVEGERITAVGKAEALPIPPTAQLFDASGQTVLPGMVDAHLHLMGDGDPEWAWAAQSVSDSLGTLALRSYVNARKNLEAGFTTLRDAGSRGFVDVALRDAINAGWLMGPRLKVAGEPLTPTGGHADPTKGLAPGVAVGYLSGVCDSADEARRATRYQIKMGADFIKISASLSAERQEMSFAMMQAICEVAHWAGRRVAAHCSGGQAVTDALQAGVDSLEHGRFLSDEQLAFMADKGVYLVPTLAPEGRAMQYGQKALGYSDGSWQWMVMANEKMYDTVARAHRAGVRVATGSDAIMAAVRHGENAYEIELLTKAGFSPMEAIEAATRVGAEALGMADEVGTVEPGKFADLVVVDGDPLADIRLLQNHAKIRWVFKGGAVAVSRP